MVSRLEIEDNVTVRTDYEIRTIPPSPEIPLWRRQAVYADGSEEPICKDSGLPESVCDCYGRWPDGRPICWQHWSDWL